VFVLAGALHESCRHKLLLLEVDCAPDQHVTARWPGTILLGDCGGLQGLQGLCVLTQQCVLEGGSLDGIHEFGLFVTLGDTGGLQRVQCLWGAAGGHAVLTAGCALMKLCYSSMPIP
jgi:hypothetical protein